MMFQLSFNQTKIYAPIFQQGSTLCDSEVNAISEQISHLLRIRSIAPIFGATKGPDPESIHGDPGGMEGAGGGSDGSDAHTPLCEDGDTAYGGNGGRQAAGVWRKGEYSGL